MTRISDICRQFQNRLIVSCQAFEGEPFRDCDSMARFAQAAEAGGAAGIRADSAEDIGAIRKVVRVAIIGIRKGLAADGRVLITGSFEWAAELVTAGADIIALDCTARGQRYGALDAPRKSPARTGRTRHGRHRHGGGSGLRSSRRR